MNEVAEQAGHIDTREKILDAAESLFTELGFAATSLRAIAGSAGVNLAATNYHFGSKLGLLQAVFHRRVQPINESRLFKLKEIRKSGRSLTTHAVLEAFFLPLAETIHDDAVPALIGRILSEPESITWPVLEEEFSQVAAAFQAALSEVLPHVSADELRWRFHFMIGSMIHTLQFQTPLGSESGASKFTEGMEQLIAYSAAGLAQSNNEQCND